MKTIKLTQGRVAIVDDEDFDWLSKWKWHYQRDKKITLVMLGEQIAQINRHNRFLCTSLL